MATNWRLVDCHFPAVSVAQRLVRLDGADLPAALAACLRLVPLDTFVPDPAARMQQVHAPDEVPEVQQLCQKEIDAAEGRHIELAGIPRETFYDRARKAYAVVVTGETAYLRLYPDQEGRGHSIEKPQNDTLFSQRSE